MAHTTHGHHIQDSTKDKEESFLDHARCGGTEMCRRCKSEVEEFWDAQRVFTGQRGNYPAEAVMTLARFLKSQGNEINTVDIYVISFTYVLRSWKAILGTTRVDNMIYEVTYNAEKRVTYVDPYLKTGNFPIPD